MNETLNPLVAIGVGIGIGACAIILLVHLWPLVILGGAAYLIFKGL